MTRAGEILDLLSGATASSGHKDEVAVNFSFSAAGQQAWKAPVDLHLSKVAASTAFILAWVNDTYVNLSSTSTTAVKNTVIIDARANMVIPMWVKLVKDQTIYIAANAGLVGVFFYVRD